MADDPLVASPCTRVCQIDSLTGWCAGCLRTIDEIAAWSTLDDPAKRLIQHELGRRRAEVDASAVRAALAIETPPPPARG